MKSAGVQRNMDSCPAVICCAATSWNCHFHSTSQLRFPITHNTQRSILPVQKHSSLSRLGVSLAERWDKTMIDGQYVPLLTLRSRSKVTAAARCSPPTSSFTIRRSSSVVSALAAVFPTWCTSSTDILTIIATSEYLHESVREEPQSVP